MTLILISIQDRKNALEEYIYDTRGKLDDRYAPFVQESEKSALLAALSEAEDWLYTEEGEDSTKSVYTARLDTLKALGDPIAKRYQEHEERAKSVYQLRETLNTYLAQATSTEDKYSHIEETEKQKVVEKCVVEEQWLKDMEVRQGERAKNVDPVLRNEEVLRKRDEVIYFAAPIMGRPKPKVSVAGGGGGSSSTGGTPGTQTPQPEQQQQEEQKKEEREMDVD